MRDTAYIAGNDLANALGGNTGRDVIYGWDPSGPEGGIASITATRVASGLMQPAFVGATPADATRLFIVEKRGKIKILDVPAEALKPTPFLNVASEIVTANEQGLLAAWERCCALTSASMRSLALARLLFFCRIRR